MKFLSTLRTPFLPEAFRLDPVHQVEPLFGLGVLQRCQPDRQKLAKQVAVDWFGEYQHDAGLPNVSWQQLLMFQECGIVGRNCIDHCKRALWRRDANEISDDVVFHARFIDRDFDEIFHAG